MNTAGQIGDACDLSTDCSDVVPFSTCIGNESTCLLGYMGVSNGSVCEKSKCCDMFMLRPTSELHLVYLNVFSTFSILKMYFTCNGACFPAVSDWRQKPLGG